MSNDNEILKVSAYQSKLLRQLGQTKTRTVDTALRWLRTKYGVYHYIHIRHMSHGELGFTPSHSLLQVEDGDSLCDIMNVQLSGDKWNHIDNALPYYDLALSEALTDELEWVVNNNKLTITERIKKYKTTSNGHQ